VEHNAERLPLVSIEFLQLANGRALDRLWHVLRLTAPPFIAHVVDIAVAAIEVASASNLDQDSVDGSRGSQCIHGPGSYRLWIRLWPARTR